MLHCQHLRKQVFVSSSFEIHLALWRKNELKVSAFWVVTKA